MGVLSVFESVSSFLSELYEWKKPAGGDTPIVTSCFSYHCQENSRIFFEVCIGAHVLTLTV